MRSALAVTLCVCLLAAGCQAQATPADHWWELMPSSHPPTTEVPLELVGGHPRLMFRPADDVGLGRSFEHVRALYRDDATFKAIFDKALAVPVNRQDPAMLAACWIVTGDDAWARASVDRMLEQKLHRSGEPYYSNVYLHALAYDWLFGHPYLTDAKKRQIVAKIVERLSTELDDLDQGGMAIWHGRNQAANGVMISALAIGDLPGCETYLRRAAAHYIETIKALQFSEGWPEGASYWIYNRAGPFAMGADCVMTALGAETIGGVPLRQVMRNIGYWQLYQYAPNGVFEPYGDSAGSLQLGQTGWWELTTDHYARLSGDAGLMAGADYLRNRSPDAYGRRPYYWRVVYTYEPSARPRGDGYDPARPELWMRKHLPQARLFGRNSMGVAFFRGDWGNPDETYATFKAGDLLAHHDHYDTGHFAIQRGGNLTPRTGFYGYYYGPHRLGYFVQTISKNCLTVLAPGETSGFLNARYPQAGRTINSGGQRVIRPTGFNCVSLDHFREQLNAGPHLERGDITAFASVRDRFDYVAADITAAYNSTRWAEPGQPAKVSLVTRQFLYLRPEQAFVIYDRVETTYEKFLPKFVMHGLSKPRSDAEERLAAPPAPTTQGDAESGIYQTHDRRLVTEHERGRLTQLVLLPERTRTLKIGGPQFCFYVETDGDQSNGFTGRNLVEGAGRQPDSVRRTDGWRVEVEPAAPARSTRFCNVLLPRLADDESPLPTVELVQTGGAADVIRVGDTLAVFARDPAALTGATLNVPGGLRCLVLDARPNTSYRVGGKTIVADGEGVLQIDRTPADGLKLEIESR